MKKKLPQSIIFLSLVSMMNDISSESLYPIMPIFLVSVLGASPAILGFLEGVTDATAAVLRYTSGAWSDLRQEKPIVVFGYALSNFSKPLIGFVQSWPQFMGLRIFDRVGKGIRESPRDAWVSKAVEETSRLRAFSFQRTFDHTGALIGPLLATGFLFLFPLHYRELFFLSAIPGILAVFFAVKAQPAPVVSESSKTESEKKLFSPVARRFFFAYGVFSLGSASDAFFILKLKEAGVGITLIPFMWACFHAVKSLSSWGVGYLSTPPKHLILLGWFLYAAAYLSMGAVSSLSAVLFVFFMYGLFYAFTESPEKTFLSRHSESSVRGRALGMYGLISGLGALPASIVFGVIAVKVSLSAAFLVAGFISAIGALLLIMV